MNKVKVFIEYFVGAQAPNVARRLRRRGFEAQVTNRQWVLVFQEGEYQAALNEIRGAMRFIAPRAVDCDWGVED